MNKKHLLILFFFLAGFHPIIYGQEVKLRCIEVMPGGDVQVHWNPFGVGTDFFNYTIYWSSDYFGPYNDSIVITALSQDTYLHPGANADVAPVYYYMRTKTISGITPPSDTLASMLLTSATIDFENIDLDWTPLTNPFTPDMHPWYLVYREYPPGNWTVVDSTVSLQASYHFWSCNGTDDTVRFRIGVKDLSYGCTSWSNPVGKVLKNQTNRFPPVMDSVSIDPSGVAVIGWEPATETDIVGYTIFQVTATNDSIGYAAGRLSTSFVHLTSSPCDGPIRYIILSVDSCGNESPFPFDSVTFLDKPHSTIYLQDIAYDPCEMTNLLTWNEYENFYPSLGYTNIYVSEEGSPFSLLTAVLPGQSSFLHTGLLPNTNYSYYVRAVSLDELKSSTSCIQNVRTYNSPSPLFMYTRYVSVEDNERVNVLFYTDTNAHVQYYRIMRSVEAGGPYEEAGVVMNEGQEFVAFSDEEADVNALSYYYQIEVVDSCGVASVIANTARTILLQVEALPDLSNHLTWNAYESWSGRVMGYKVYRSLDDASPVLLANLDSLSFSLTDDVSTLTGSVSKITYKVMAFEGSNNTYGFNEVSFSNEVVSDQEPKVYMPNAFAPHGLNSILKPVNVFVGSEGYEFIIYNRWGQMIFSTTDPDEGWNGQYNGDYVPMDVYVYILNFRNAMNEPRHIKGNVLVLY